MQWVSAMAETPDFNAALDSVCETLQSELDGPPDVIFAYPSVAYGELVEGLIDAVDRLWPGVPVIGCVAGGVIGEGVEVEGRRALAMTAARLPGVEVRPFHLSAGGFPGRADVEGWRTVLGLPEDEVPHFIVHPDPLTCDAEHLIEGLDGAWPQGTVVGGLASGHRRPKRHTLFAGDQIYTEGVVGVALTGDLTVETVVAQGCRPIGQPMFVTRSARHTIAELDGQPATEVLAELFETLTPEERELFRTSLSLGLVMDPTAQMYRQGDFLIRPIMGVDPETGVLAVGDRVETSQVVQFHLRDGATSEADLRGLLHDYREGLAGEAPAGALMFSCLGRGEGLYGQPDLDCRIIEGTLGPVPVTGFFGNGELGPIHGRTFLHGYTTALAFFRPRNCQ